VPPAELSPQELAKLSKEERTAYHKARRSVSFPAEAKESQTLNQKNKQLTKAERRIMQEAQRKAKEDQKTKSGDNEELLKELKLQGLSDEQAKELIAEMQRAEDVEQDGEADDDEPEDLLSTVRKWMAEQEGQVHSDILHDFNLKVRFQGHVDTTPPDHILAIIRVIVEETCSQCDLAAPKIQPTAVVKKVEPAIVRWAPLLEPLYGKIADPLTGADVVLRGVREGVETLADVPEAGRSCAVVGCLMAIREIEMIEDEDLLTGCRRAEPKSRVMDKFIEFLEDELEDDEDADGEGEDND